MSKKLCTWRKVVFRRSDPGLIGVGLFNAKFFAWLHSFLTAFARCFLP